MRPIAVLTSLVALLVAPAGAAAELKVGVADNAPTVFVDPLYLQLGSKITRKIVPIDTIDNGGWELADLDAYMLFARARGVEVVIAFNHSRDHEYGTTRDLPSPAEFRRSFEKYRERYPNQLVFNPWNEMNHFTQPTHEDPERAAEFANIAKRLCRKCTIVPDFMGQEGLARYFARYRRALRFEPEAWGLHNYSDTNRFRSRDTREFLRLTRRGEVWLTETGGIVQLCPRRCSLERDERRAARAIAHMFELARSDERITRLYPYAFYGVDREERFDAGLVGPDGRRRPAYAALQRELARERGR